MKKNKTKEKKTQMQNLEDEIIHKEKVLNQVEKNLREKHHEIDRLTENFNMYIEQIKKNMKMN